MKNEKIITKSGASALRPLSSRTALIKHLLQQFFFIDIKNEQWKYLLQYILFSLMLSYSIFVTQKWNKSWRRVSRIFTLACMLGTCHQSEHKQPLFFGIDHFEIWSFYSLALTVSYLFYVLLMECLSNLKKIDFVHF